VYTGPHGNRIAVWEPAKPQGRLAWLVFVHGGYWYKGNYTTGGTELCQDEAQRGRACFSVDYRLVPTVTWPTPLLDVRADLGWIRARERNFHLNAADGFIVGASAGALMAAIVGLSDGHLKGLVTLSGVTDAYDAFSDPVQHANPRTARNTLRLFGGVRPTQDWPLWRSGRAMTYMTKKAKRLPVLIEHGRADTTIFPKMSRDFATRLSAARYPVSYYHPAGYTHYDLRPIGIVNIDRWLGALAVQPSTPH
jgi:acetyl esterase/lipase